MGAEGKAEGKKVRPVETRRRVVWDANAIARVPGGIASNRVTIQVLGQSMSPSAPVERG